MTRSLLVVDFDKCTGCMSCVLACTMAKEKVFDRAKSRIQVYKDEENCLSLPIICEHCEHPPCKVSCPVNAIEKDEAGIVKITEKCTGCMLCRLVCPFGSETIAIRNRKAFKCDLCNGQPECVEACIPGALRFVPQDPTTTEEKWRLAEKRALTLTSIAVGKAK